MKSVLCCFRLEKCIGATYWLNTLQMAWCGVCIGSKDSSNSMLIHGTFIQDHNDVIAFSVAVIFMTLLKIILLFFIDKNVRTPVRRFRFLFFLMLLFFAAFLVLYLVVGISFAAEGYWHALTVFAAYGVLAFYLLLCFYSLKTLTEGLACERYKGTPIR